MVIVVGSKITISPDMEQGCPCAPDDDRKEQVMRVNPPVLRTTYETPEECPECLEHLSLDWAYCPNCGRPTDWNNSKLNKDILKKRLDKLEKDLKRLQSDLDKITIERDKAIRDLYIARNCDTCKWQYTDKCLLEESISSCSEFAEGDVPYEWRGLVK